MSVFSFLTRNKQTETPEERRQILLQHGRITDGMIIDNEIGDNDEEVVFFVYTLNGVDFESSERLSAEQKADPVKYAPGAKVGVRYDPKNQGNSTLE